MVGGKGSPANVKTRLRRAYRAAGKMKETKMKKLMMAAAIVCAVASVQAANVTWKAAGIEASTASSADGYITYFLMATDDTGAMNSKLWSIEDATAAAQAKDASAFASHTIPAAKVGTVDTEEAFTISSAKYTGSASSWVSTSGDSKYGYFYAVVFNAETIADATEFLIAGGAEADGSAKLLFGTATANQSINLAAGAWQAIPEPTSGLLMLLGIAGLALKRKRA